MWIMKRSVLYLLLVMTFLLTGCDFMRKMAGRPTSEDIEKARVAVLMAEEARLQEELDSLRIAKQAVQDSIGALEQFRQQGGTVLNPAAMGGLFTTCLEHRYYVIIGAFRSRSNAERLMKMAEATDYKPVMISFRNGLMAVGLCPVDEKVSAIEAVARVRKEEFCPADVWILVNE